jgi:hypothetical protein
MTGHKERRLSEWRSAKPPKVKILFYSLTRIKGERKAFSMNDEGVCDGKICRDDRDHTAVAL